jgi:hypothetical protein
MATGTGTVNAKSIEEIKSFISRQSDIYKTPYATHPKTRLRQCVFTGDKVCSLQIFKEALDHPFDNPST